jgi:Fe-S oxidoreductase
MPSLYNFFATNKYTSAFLKRVLRFASQREIPSLSRRTLRALARKRVRVADSYAPVVYLFADEFTNYNEAEVGLEFIRLLEGCGYRVVVPSHTESGRAALSKGLLRRAKRLADKNVRALRELVSEDAPLVGIEPSAILSFRDEYPDLVSEELRDDALRLSRNVLLYDEFVMREVEKGRIVSSMFTDDSLEIKLHGHCHQKSLASAEASARMLSIPVNYHAELLETGCCGMAGSFGFEKEHYSYSVEVGEQKLLPLVRSFGKDVMVSAPGTSCRQQIREGSGRLALHPVQILARALRQ